MTLKFIDNQYGWLS